MNNTNPFFQYVNNNKTSTLTIPHQPTPNTNIQPKNITNIKNPLPQTKPSDTLVDPRKPNQTNPTIQSLHKPDQPKKLSTQTRPQIDDLKQKRSRSRQRKISKNRQNSEQSNKKQKKDQHFHKTKLCPLFEKGQCKKGAQCHFAHGLKELRGLPNFYKTRICLSFQKGECKKPSFQCKYAHGKGQLRDLKHDAGYSSSVSQIRNESKTKERDQKRNGNDERKKNNERKDREDRFERDRRSRQSESYHRKERRQRDSKHRQDSNDRRKKNEKSVQNPLGYKKNIPLNKEYEKYLYNDPEVKTTQIHNSMYMLPNAMIQPGKLKYDPQYYSVNTQRKQPQKAIQSLYSSSNQAQNYSQYNKNYKQVPNFPYNYPPVDQPNNLPPAYYENSGYNPNQPNFGYPKPQDKFSQRNLNPEDGITPIISQGYNMNNPINQYPPFYQSNPSELVSDFKTKDSYKGFNINYSNNQSYRNQSVHNIVPKDYRFLSPSYSQNPQNLPSGVPFNEFVEKPSQNFYNNEPFYPSSSTKKNENNFFNPNQQSLQSNPQINYPKNGFYDLYPALDNSVNKGQKYPYSYEKSSYSGFSNNLPK